VLAFAHAVLGSQLAVAIIVAGLAGALLAESSALATLPISIVVLVSMLTAPAASLRGGAARGTGLRQGKRACS
jgi:hypothetical protein